MVSSNRNFRLRSTELRLTRARSVPALAAPFAARRL